MAAEPSPPAASSTLSHCHRCGFTKHLSVAYNYRTLTLEGKLVTVEVWECANRAACTERLDEQMAVIKLQDLKESYQRFLEEEGRNKPGRHYNKSNKWDQYNGFTGG